MGVKEYCRFFFQLYKMELAAALEYRVNFIMQTLFMFLNDFVWIFFWYLLFSRFGTINGYNYDHLLLLWAVATISFALVQMLFGNTENLAKMIENGGLDYYLTLPKNVLAHSVARLRYSAVGDLLFGIVLAVWTLNISQVPLLILLIFTSALVYFGWLLITQSCAFFFGSFEQAGKLAGEIFLSGAIYPFSLFEGATRFFLLFIMPAGFMAGIPVELLTSFSWKWLAITVLFCAAFFALSVWVFYRGLRRYESGNVLAMRE